MKMLLVLVEFKDQGWIFPDFSKLEVIKASSYNVGRNWVRYLDKEGLDTPWIDDITCNASQVSAESPRGTQLKARVVPDAFADQADAMYNNCKALTDAEAKEYYEKKVSVYSGSEIINNDILGGIKKKEDLGLTLTQDQLNARDPGHSQPGITKNKFKTWAGFKTNFSI